MSADSLRVLGTIALLWFIVAYNRSQRGEWWARLSATMVVGYVLALWWGIM